MHHNKCSMADMKTWLSFKFYLFTLSVVVFTPQSSKPNNFFGFIELSWEAEKLLNVLLLIPLGYFIFKLYPQTRNLKILIICSMSSALIETIQFAIPGRFPDITDVFANSLGVSLFLLKVRNRESIDRQYAKKIRKLGQGNHLNLKD